MQERPESTKYLVNDHMSRRLAAADRRRTRGRVPRRGRRRVWHLLSLSARG